MHVTLVGVLGDRVRGDGYDNDIISQRLRFGLYLRKINWKMEILIS